MNTSIFHKLLLMPILILLFIPELFALVIIKSDNPNFQYTGRIDFSVPDQPVMYWPGTYIKANFEGSVLIVMLDDQTGQSYYNVFVDEDYAHPKVIDCLAGNHIYVVSATLSDTIHSILITRRTEASTGPTKFIGIQLNDGKTLLPPTERSENKIMFYGNSITCGMGNEAPDGSGDDNMLHENNFLAYGSIASRILNAEYMCTAKSGIGIMISWFDMVMDDYYYRLNPDDVNSNWDFNEFIPDVVVINLFQNDSWLVGGINPVPDSSQRVAAYIAFVREIRSRHPEAFIVCALGSMDATKAGSPWPGYIESAVENLRIQDNDSLLSTLFFPFDPAWTKHPRVRHHQVMAQNLANHINEQMNWITNVDDIFYNELPTTFTLSQNYPNPFNPTTTINYSVQSPGIVRLVVFDMLGQEVKTIINEYKNLGNYKVVFNSGNISSGVYYYQLMQSNNIQTKSMVILK